MRGRVALELFELKFGVGEQSNLNDKLPDMSVEELPLLPLVRLDSGND